MGFPRFIGVMVSRKMDEALRAAAKNTKTPVSKIVRAAITALLVTDIEEFKKEKNHD